MIYNDFKIIKLFIVSKTGKTVTLFKQINHKFSQIVIFFHYIK